MAAPGPADYWPIVIDPRFPWIRGHHQNTRAFPARVADLRTGETAIVKSRDELVRFVADHSAGRSHMGLGDAVRALTKKLGFGECTPCQKRQAALNAAVPRLWRR